MSGTLPADEVAWEQVLARDTSARFVYAVSTTGIVCRPSCPSRRPERVHVHFFADARQAISAGFRPCLRCRPTATGPHPDTALIYELCAYLRSHKDRSVTLGELAQRSGLSAFTVQRKFERILGVTPRQFQLDLRSAGFRKLLADHPENPQTITDAVYEAGYSASSRLYSGSKQKLGMTPSRFRDGGSGETIRFVTTPSGSGFGFVLVAATRIGICWVALGDSPEFLETQLRKRFHRAAVGLAAEDDSGLKDALATVLSQYTDHPAASRLPLDLRATVFQQRVWRALTQIPRGETRSYGQIAAELGQPAASRAVARACASNPVALLVPCHRVVGMNGDLTGYRWGIERKASLLKLEKEAVEKTRTATPDLR